jgi:hypothetical protein
MPDPRILAAWEAEKLRQRRRSLAYWRSILQVYLILTALTFGFLGGSALLVSLLTRSNP